MGLTVRETALFCVGSVLIVWYLLRTALPGFSRHFGITSRRYSDTLREEFIHLPPALIGRGLLFSGFLVGSCVLAITKSTAVGLFSGGLPVFLAGTVIRRYRTRRRKKVLSQLPILLDLVSGHLKAGHSIQESLSETVPLLPSGIREEMAWVLQQNRLGTSLVDSFSLWEERIPSEDVSLFVGPLRAAIPGGGNIVDLLEQTRDILRRRMRTKEKLKSLTAQARLQAVVLTLLPPAFTLALSRIDSDFLSNLIGTPQGKTILLIAGILQILGWVTIRKILSVRV